MAKRFIVERPLSSSEQFLESISESLGPEILSQAIEWNQGSEGLGSPDEFIFAPDSSKHTTLQSMVDRLAELMANDFASMFIGKTEISPYNFDYGPLKNAAVDDGKTFEREMVKAIEFKIGESVKKEAKTRLFRETLQELAGPKYKRRMTAYRNIKREFNNRNYDTDLVWNDFGRFFESFYLGGSEAKFNAPGTGGQYVNDPRPDFFDISLEVKTTSEDTGLLHVGQVGITKSENSSFLFNAAKNQKGVDINKQLSPLIDKVALRNIDMIISTYKISIKMRNLLLVYARNVQGFAAHARQFDSITLYTLLNIKKVWDEVSLEIDKKLNNTKSKSISITVDKDKDKNTFSYDISFKHPKSAKNNPIDLPFGDLYRRQIDLLSIVRKPSEENFRRALFGFFRNNEGEYFRPKTGDVGYN